MGEPNKNPLSNLKFSLLIMKLLIRMYFTWAFWMCEVAGFFAIDNDKISSSQQSVSLVDSNKLGVINALSEGYQQSIPNHKKYGFHLCSCVKYSCMPIVSQKDTYVFNWVPKLSVYFRSMDFRVLLNCSTITIFWMVCCAFNLVMPNLEQTSRTR